MKSIRRDKKGSKPSPEATSRLPGRSSGFEWPLLVFPAAVLAAVATLYMVNRSIQQQASMRPAAASVAPTTPAAKAPPASNVAIEDKAKPVPQPKADSASKGKAPKIKSPPTLATDNAQVVATKSAGPKGPEKPPLDGLEGPARIIAVLQDAIRQNDHARIKQCIDELVALGDQAIAPLTQLIANEQGEAGMWAAEALARIGSPLATTTLLETLASIKEGPYKEQIAKRVANINNHESWPVLLDNVLNTADATVLRAAGSALSRMADAPVVDELLARLDAAGSDQDVERIANVISHISSSAATDALIALAGDVASAPQTAVQRAAIEGLGNIGDPQAVSYLMRKLEAASPGESGYLINTISQIKGAQAQDALLYAAAGNREVSADNGRTAAIYALKNFPDARTCALLQQIVTTEQNASVVAAATRTLDDIERTSPHIVANAQSLIKKDTSPGLVKK